MWYDAHTTCDWIGIEDDQHFQRMEAESESENGELGLRGCETKELQEIKRVLKGGSVLGDWERFWKEKPREIKASCCLYWTCNFMINVMMRSWTFHGCRHIVEPHKSLGLALLCIALLCFFFFSFFFFWSCRLFGSLLKEKNQPHTSNIHLMHMKLQNYP